MNNKLSLKQILLGIIFLGLLVFSFWFQDKRRINQKSLNDSTSIDLPSSPFISEESLLNFPSNLSSEEGKKWIDNITSLEKTDQIINISNCKPSPLVLRVKKGAELQFKNNDNMEMTLYSHGNKYEISPLSTIVIKAVFDPDTTGFFGYRCRFGSKPQTPVVGILHITE